MPGVYGNVLVFSLHVEAVLIDHRLEKYQNDRE
jgi:hypothetical protein